MSRKVHASSKHASRGKLFVLKSIQEAIQANGDELALVAE